MTNKSSNFNESRNIIAFQDLGEHDPHIFNEIPDFQENYGLPYPENVFPHNNANRLYQEMNSTYNGIRDSRQITSIMSQFSPGFVGGQDFEKVDQARKLSPSEYTINERLGYISLNTALNADEVLAVAFSYTSSGKIFQVGEFSTDGVEAPQTLVLKLIKGTNLSPGLPTWDLMMKNIYNLDTYQLTNDEFILNIVYQNDSTGTYINYLPEGRIKGHILLEVMNLDKLNKQLDPYKDGIFDYIEGITVNSGKGRIIFPVLEPFGKVLADSLQDPVLIGKYVFSSLYDSTQIMAAQDAEHNKFRLVGSYKGAAGSDIALGALNLAQGSVKVSAGGRELIENIDYTVDYTLGQVRIINQALLEAGTPIRVSTESEDLFTMQRKTLLGTHANYAFSDNFNIGATALYMQERPLTKKVNYGEDPISNLMVGMDARYSTQSMFLTKVVDALPFYSTNTPSVIDVEAEVAKLIPGHSRVIEKSGNAYIDDFEGTKTGINLKAWQAWSLSSTQQHQADLFPEGNLTNQLEFGFNRAKLAFYIIDPLFLRNNSLTPKHIKNDPDQQSNHFVREVYEKEIFPAKESPVGEPTNIPVFDVAFYPEERGPYNFDTHPSPYSAGINSDGTLAAPETRWGGIMRSIETSDFETSNVEFIECWMMDPFINDSTSTQLGGDLYFNLGNISEDVLKDSRRFYENGLPTPNLPALVDTSIWGSVPRNPTQVTNAFSNDPADRPYQDVGFDGLTDSAEAVFRRNDYLNVLAANFGTGSKVYQDALADPSSDNYQYYRGSHFDTQGAGILERYKRYSNPQGNSPIADNNSQFSSAATMYPDQEDVNHDNTLNETEEYFQYMVTLKPSTAPEMSVGTNHIVDKKVVSVNLPNGQTRNESWYQFRIPLDGYNHRVGNIPDFKSIRFVRMYLTGFEDSVTVRFGKLDLVRNTWRKFQFKLDTTGNYTRAETDDFNVGAVNIEENDRRQPLPYRTPREIERDQIISNNGVNLLQNEQSLTLKFENLARNDAKAVFQTFPNRDLRRFKKMELFIHAEQKG